MHSLPQIPAKIYAGIQSRALTLYQRGYRAQEIVGGVYRVTGGSKPYVVDRERFICECRSWQQWEICKHCLGIDDLLRQQEQARRRDLRQAIAEVEEIDQLATVAAIYWRRFEREGLERDRIKAQEAEAQRFALIEKFDGEWERTSRRVLMGRAA